MHDGKKWFFLSPGASPPVTVDAEAPNPETRDRDSRSRGRGLLLDFSAPPAGGNPLPGN